MGSYSPNPRRRLFPAMLAAAAMLLASFLPALHGSEPHDDDCGSGCCAAANHEAPLPGAKAAHQDHSPRPAHKPHDESTCRICRLIAANSAAPRPAPAPVLIGILNQPAPAAPPIPVFPASIHDREPGAPRGPPARTA